MAKNVFCRKIKSDRSGEKIKAQKTKVEKIIFAFNIPGKGSAYQRSENVEKSNSRSPFDEDDVSLISHRPATETDQGLIPIRRIPSRVL